MSRWLEKSKDAFHGALDGLIGCLGDVVSELLLAVAACGLLAFAWWGYQHAPYVTAAVGAGVLLAAGAGVLLFAAVGALVLWCSGGGRLADGWNSGRVVGRLAMTAVAAAGAVVVLLAYLPSCGCLD